MMRMRALTEQKRNLELVTSGLDLLKTWKPQISLNSKSLKKFHVPPSQLVVLPHCLKVTQRPPFYEITPALPSGYILIFLLSHNQ